MEQYIPKSAVLAEIEKLIRKNELYLDDNASDPVRFQKTGAYSVLYDFLHFLNTIEDKEVDFSKCYHEFLQREWFGNPHVRTFSEMMVFTAKYFFELGMAVSNKV